MKQAIKSAINAKATRHCYVRVPGQCYLTVARAKIVKGALHIIPAETVSVVTFDEDEQYTYTYNAQQEYRLQADSVVVVIGKRTQWFIFNPEVN